MDDADAVFAREGHQIVVKGARSHRAHGIGGEGDDHHLRPARSILVDGSKVGQIAAFLVQRVIGDLRAAQRGADGEDGVAGVGHEHHVAGVAQRHGDVGDALLRAVHAHHFIFCQRDAVAPRVPALYRLRKFGKIAQRVLVIFRVERRLRSRRADVLGHGKVRRAHGKVAHPLAARKPLLFQVFEDVEDIGLKAQRAPGKLPVHTLLLL